MQVYFDAFSQESMSTEPAPDFHLPQSLAGPPNASRQCPNDEIDHCQSKVTSQESGDQQQHDQQREKFARHQY